VIAVCIALSSAAQLIRLRATTITTTVTTSPLLAALNQTEWYMNSTMDRLASEMNQTHQVLVEMNLTVQAWLGFNMKVNDNVTNKSLIELANNTAVMAEVRNDSAFTKLNESLRNFSAMVDKEEKKASNLSQSLGLGSISISSASASGNATGNSATAVVDDFEKVRSNYYVNGSKITNGVNTLDKIESTLETVNLTMFVDAIVNRHIIDSVATIPQELTNQLDMEVMKIKTMNTTANASVNLAGTWHLPVLVTPTGS
jgi:hypothetical protein